MPVNIGAGRTGDSPNARMHRRSRLHTKKSARPAVRTSLRRLGLCLFGMLGRFRDRTPGGIFHRTDRPGHASADRWSASCAPACTSRDPRTGYRPARRRSTPANVHTELADAYLRHGLHRTVVSLEATGSGAHHAVQHRPAQPGGRRGGAHPALAAAAPDRTTDERLLGLHARWVRATSSLPGRTANHGAQRCRRCARPRPHFRRQTTCRRWPRPNTSAAGSSAACCSNSMTAGAPPKPR